jgi:hypothetical protein
VNGVQQEENDRSGDPALQVEENIPNNEDDFFSLKVIYEVDDVGSEPDLRGSNWLGHANYKWGNPETNSANKNTQSLKFINSAPLKTKLIIADVNTTVEGESHSNVRKSVQKVVR